MQSKDSMTVNYSNNVTWITQMSEINVAATPTNTQTFFGKLYKWLTNFCILFRKKYTKVTKVYKKYTKVS